MKAINVSDRWLTSNLFGLPCRVLLALDSVGGTATREELLKMTGWDDPRYLAVILCRFQKAGVVSLRGTSVTLLPPTPEEKETKSRREPLPL